MSREEIERLVRHLYEMRRKEDVEAVMALFAENATFVVAGSKETSPLPVEAHGRPAIREVVGRQVAAFDIEPFEFLKIMIDGQDVAVHWRALLTLGEKSFATEVVDLLRIEGGKVASFREFADTAFAVQFL